MWTPYQIILWSCFIHLLVTLSTAYFSLLLAIIEQSPYFLPNIFLIAIGIDPWILPGCYHYITTDHFFHLHEEYRSHFQRKMYIFNNWNATWYIWVVKNMDILASSLIYMYGVDKTHNSILNMPLFHTPASHLSRNGHYTMGKIYEWKLATTNLFRIFGGRFFPQPLPDILTKHNTKETSSIGNIWGQLCIPKVKGLDGR